MFQQLTPELHPDQLLLDRAHRLQRPSHLPTTAARDVIARVHFFHAKERIIRANRNKGMPEKYHNIKIFSDLSAETLQFRKSVAQITLSLRTQGLSYRWGYPAKLLVYHQDSLHSITSAPQGIRLMGDWGILLAEMAKTGPAKVPRLTQVWASR
ncbi:Hypothetical predicted protein [Pelobates cultripes]|uniref:Uncharacterized protein n=1 Tax=Pelobates cultripes TaxID=61616 RepID=A0AAD1RMK3_PELCU|nr:Hypothetical predicted protein [Pelobates cultripes]